MKNNMLLLIQEFDHSDKERCVIGIAESSKFVEQMINEYYGGLQKELTSTVGDENNLWLKIFEVLDHNNKPYKVTVWVDYYCINQI